MAPNYGILAQGVLEACGLAALPFPLYRRPPSSAVRAAKPLLIVLLCYALSTRFDEKIGLARRSCAGTV